MSAHDIVITVNGGIVSAIYAADPSLDVVVIDYDNLADVVVAGGCAERALVEPMDELGEDEIEQLQLLEKREAEPEPERLFRCGNSGEVYNESDLVPARDLMERLDFNGPFTRYECPDCGALAYLIEEDR